MDTWTIGRLARAAGLRTSAIRFYEAAGLLPAAERHNGRRHFDPSALDRLALIRLGQQAGFTIAELKLLLHGFDRRTPPPARWRKLAHRKLEEVRDQAARVRTMQAVLERLLACDCPTLDDCGRAWSRLPASSRRRDPR